jgi:hypothetical protein
MVAAVQSGLNSTKQNDQGRRLQVRTTGIDYHRRSPASLRSRALNVKCGTSTGRSRRDKPRSSLPSRIIRRGAKRNNRDLYLATSRGPPELPPASCLVGDLRHSKVRSPLSSQMLFVDRNATVDDSPLLYILAESEDTESGSA